MIKDKTQKVDGGIGGGDEAPYGHGQPLMDWGATWCFAAHTVSLSKFWILLLALSLKKSVERGK